MKLRDMNRSIDLVDAEVDEIHEYLVGKDKTSDEYRNGIENLKRMLEAEQLAIRNRNDFLSGKLPEWGVSIIVTVIGTVTALGFGWKVLTEERGDGVVSSQAINMFDRVIRKF